jgi:hypothetical protein
MLEDSDIKSEEKERRLRLQNENRIYTLERAAIEK